MRKFLLACMVLQPFALFSQKVWSLQECVDHAVQHNLQVKQAVTTTAISQDDQTQKLLSMFPSLNFSSSYSQNYGRSVDPFTNDFTNQTFKSASLSLNSGVTVFDGFQLQNELKKSKLDYMASKYDLEKITNDISLSVAAAYLQVLYKKEQLVAATDRAATAAQLRDRTAKLVESGSLAQGSLLDAESQLANEELATVNAQNELNLAVLSLAQLLELETTDGFEIESPRVDIPDQSALTVSPADIYDVAVREKPEIKSSEYKMQSAEKSVSIARGGMSPRLRAFGSISSGYSNQARQVVGDPVLITIPTGGYLLSG